MSEIKKIITDRYPGPKPYGEKEKDLFFGRSLESEALSEALFVHHVFVLHAESGLGKSSLIAAGLMPRLRTGNFLPVLIRFKDRKTHPAKVITEAIQESLKKKIQEENIHSDITPEEDDVWKLVKKVNTLDIIPVLIFDQFEEFNYYNDSIKKETIRILSELVALKIPDYIRKEFASGSGTFPEGWYAQPKVKIMFSIRTDRIGMMEEFADSIPETRTNRYELSPIQSDQGEQIVILPAAMEPTDEIEFNCQGFQYEPKLINTILDIVKRKDNTIDTTQLQIICLEIQERVKSKPLTGGDLITVTENELGGKKGLEDLVKNFYSKQLAKISQNPDINPAEYLAVRILLEKKLIVQQKKDRLSEESLFQHFRDHKVPEDRIKLLLDELLSLRLIRGIDFEESTFYEIAHDTLIEPILEEMQKRELEETLEKEKKQAEDLAREQEEKLRKQRLETAKEMELKNKAIEAEMYAREAEKNATTARFNVERLKKRNERLALLFTFFLVLGIGFFIYQFIVLRTEKKRIRKVLVKLYSSEAQDRYNEGERILAYAIWDHTKKHGASDSEIVNAKRGRSFPPFSISINSPFKSAGDIQVSKDLRYAGTRYSYLKFIIWKINDKENTIEERLKLDGISSFFLLPNNKVIVIDTARAPNCYDLEKGNDSAPDPIPADTSKRISVERIQFLEQSKLVILEDTINDNKYFFSLDSLRPLKALDSWYLDFKKEISGYNKQASNIPELKFYSFKPAFLPLDKNLLLINFNNFLFYIADLEYHKTPVEVSINKNKGIAIGKISKKIAYNDAGRLMLFDINSKNSRSTGLSTDNFDIPVEFFCNDSVLLIKHVSTQDDNSLPFLTIYNIPRNKVTRKIDNHAILNLQYCSAMNLFGFIDEERQLKLFDVERNEYVNFSLPQLPSDAVVKDYKFDEFNKRIYIKLSSNNLITLVRKINGEFDAAITKNVLPIEIYGSKYYKINEIEKRIHFISLIYQDTAKNNIRYLQQAFRNYIDKEIKRYE